MGQPAGPSLPGTMHKIRKAAMTIQEKNIEAKKKNIAKTPTKPKSLLRRKSMWAKISVDSKDKARAKLKMRVALDAALKLAQVKAKTTYDSEVFRIIVMGANKTGKTTLCSRIVGCEPNMDKGTDDRLLISSADPSAMSGVNSGVRDGLNIESMTLDSDMDIGLGMMAETTQVLYQARPTAVVVSDSVIDDDNIITVTHSDSAKPVVVGSGVFEASADVPKVHELDDPQVKYAYKTVHGRPEFTQDQPEEKDYEVYAARINVSAHDLGWLKGLTGLTGLTNDSDDESLTTRRMASRDGMSLVSGPKTGGFGIGSGSGRTSSMRSMNRARAVRNDALAKMVSDYGVQLVEAPDDPFNEQMGIASGVGSMIAGSGDGDDPAQKSRRGVKDDVSGEGNLEAGGDHEQQWDDETAIMEDDARERAYDLVHEAITSLGVSTSTLQEKDPRTGNDDDEEGRFGNLFLGYEYGTLTNPIARRDAKRETTDRETAKGHNPTNTLWMNCIAGAAIILYDIQKPQSFARARALCREIHESQQSTGNSRPVPILIIANFSDMASSLVYDYGKDEDLITSERAFFAHGTMVGNRVVHQGQVHTVVELVHRLCITMKDMHLFKLGPKKIVEKDWVDGEDDNGVTKETNARAHAPGAQTVGTGVLARSLSQSFHHATGGDDKGGGEDDKKDRGSVGGRKGESGLGWCW